MGCAFVSKKQLISSKDVDLNFTTPYFKETNDTVNINNTLSGEVLQIKPSTKKTSKINIVKEKEKEDINVNNSTKQNFSGPIITMLKRKVDNYKKAKKV